jgi:hypothetical protein
VKCPRLNSATMVLGFLTRPLRALGQVWIGPAHNGPFIGTP